MIMSNLMPSPSFRLHSRLRCAQCSGCKTIDRVEGDTQERRREVMLEGDDCGRGTCMAVAQRDTSNYVEIKQGSVHPLGGDSGMRGGERKGSNECSVHALYVWHGAQGGQHRGRITQNHCAFQSAFLPDFELTFTYR